MLIIEKKLRHNSKKSLLHTRFLGMGKRDQGMTEEKILKMWVPEVVGSTHLVVVGDSISHLHLMGVFLEALEEASLVVVVDLISTFDTFTKWLYECIFQS